MAGHHGFDYLPPGIYAHLIKISRENELSVKELKMMFIQEWCQKTGFRCEHPFKKMKYDSERESAKWHCTQCWRRFDKEDNDILENGHLLKKTYFVPVETFTDKFNIEAKFNDGVESKKQFQDLTR